jgi:uncharacterized membrane protein YhhN
MTTAQKALLYIFVTFAILFIALPWVQPYAINVAIKAIPAISLAVLAFVAVNGARGKLLFVSLLFYAAGDIGLELPIEMAFVLGLGMGHVPIGV